MVGNDTLIRPGGDAAVVRVHGTNKALAITTDCTPRYVFADPVEGGKQAVAETWRNITCVGATPLAITNCLNFGNPQKPQVMGQIVGALAGMKEACLALDYPVVSGNVSLYNDTEGKSVLPTPAIGGVGILADVNSCIGNAFTQSGDAIFLIGHTKGHLQQSLYMREIMGLEEGVPPPVDLVLERKHGDFVRRSILQKILTACHDCSDGGLLVALAEMCMGKHIGATITLPQGETAAIAFGEDQGRYIVCAAPQHKQQFIEEAEKAGVACTLLGTTGGEVLAIEGHADIALSQLRQLHEATIRARMSQ